MRFVCCNQCNQLNHIFGQSVAEPPNTPGGASSGDLVPEAAPPPPPPFVEPPVGPSDLVGPTSLGYYSINHQSRLRIQRGRPAGSLYVNCYFHANCSFTVTLARAPTDAEIKEWLFTIPSCPAGMTRERKKYIVERHKNRAYSRWGSDKRKAQAIADMAAESLDI